MAEYLLYGQRLIENDDTLAEFSKSLCKTLIADHQIEVANNDDFMSDCLSAVRDDLSDDISRTDIDYIALMFKYRAEIGDVLYEMENMGREPLHVNFFGEEAEQSFNYIVCGYIEVHFYELFNAKWD